MKLGTDTLIEIMDIFRSGLEEMKDVSQDFRNIDLTQGPDGTLVLSDLYKAGLSKKKS